MFQQQPRRNPSAPLYGRRASRSTDPDLAQIGEQLEKLKRFGAPEPGIPVKTRIVPPPQPPTQPAVPTYRHRSSLTLPVFVPPPLPVPAAPPQPARRAVGPAPRRVVNVRDAMQLAMALSQARPGDQITLADGDYVLPNKRYALTGTAEHPITLVSAKGHATLVGGNNPHTLQLDRSSHLILNGLRFAPRINQTARAINVTDGNHITIANCWIGEGSQPDVAPIHFGADTSGRYNNHNTITGCVIYAQASACIHFGPGGGQDARILDNELRALGPEGNFSAMVAFTPGSMAVYRNVTLRGNRLASEAGCGSGFALNGVLRVDLAGNTLRLMRDLTGRGGTFVETRADANLGGQVSALMVHHNDFAYDRPGTADARPPFQFGMPVQATFTQNAASYLGAYLADGKYASMVEIASGLEEPSQA